jgi:hypothetical protein
LRGLGGRVPGPLSFAMRQVFESGITILVQTSPLTLSNSHVVIPVYSHVVIPAKAGIHSDAPFQLLSDLSLSQHPL